ncbi:substrate-binding domain-containing protein [Paenibacillus chitinolyticus]|uniref:substrate-binding domain-containing protein n=1 Tax=Paenibacillus chitinolyticus TaxID=79263 RepID=UPI00364F2682
MKKWAPSKWTVGLAVLFALFVLLLGRFAYTNAEINGIVRDIEDRGRTPAPGGKMKHVVMISQELDNPFWRTIEQGARDAAEQYNIKLEYSGPYRNNIEEQAELFGKAIAGKPDGILIQGIRSEAYNKQIDKAVEQGIAVLTVDTDSPDSRRLSYVGTDNVESGRQLGELVAKAYEGRSASIGMVIGSYEAGNQQQRLEGFRSVVDAEPNLKIVEVGVSNISRIQATQAAEHILRSREGINVMVGTSALDALGILQASKSLNKQEQVRIFGFDDLTETREALARKEIEATVIQKPYTMGFRSIEMLNRYFEGETLPGFSFTRIDILNPQNVGTAVAP